MVLGFELIFFLGYLDQIGCITLTGLQVQYFSFSFKNWYKLCMEEKLV